MVAIRSFMDTDAKGQLGGIECEAEARRKMAGESRAFTCGVCARSNESILREREEAAREVAGEKREEEVPAELRLAYRDELGKGEGEKGKENANSEAGADVKAGGKGKEKEVDAEPSAASSSSVPLTTSPPPVIPAPNRTVPVQAQAPNPRSVRRESSLAWIDACIYGVLAALLFMLLRKVIL